MLASNQASADAGAASIIELDLAVIEVASDGETYTTVLGSSPTIKGRMQMYLDTHKYGRVKSWALWPSIKPQTGNAHGKEQFQELGYSKSYPLGDRPKKVTRDVPFSIPLQSYKAYAKEVCNHLAYELRTYYDKDNEEIFAIDRLVPLKVDAEVTWEMSGSAIENPTPVQVTPQPENLKIKTVTIKCLKVPPIPPAVTGSAVVVQGYDPVNFQGQCQLKLNGSLISNLPNVDVTFRYVDDKGKQSDLKSVTTNANRSANFEHKYPLSPGHKTGKIRIVGQNFNFTSNWKNYDFECSDDPTNDLLVALPPKPTYLEAIALAERKNVEGNICPIRMRVSGILKGEGKAAGTAVLAVNGMPRVQEAYDIKQGEMIYLDGEHVFSWSADNVDNNEVTLQFIVLNAKGEQVDMLSSKQSFKCQPIVEGVLTLTPPKVTHIEANAHAEKFSFQQYVCPARVRVSAVLKGKGTFSGRAVVIVGNTPKAQKPFTIKDGQTMVVEGDQNLSWNRHNAPGQEVKFQLAVIDNKGVQVGHLSSSETFKCIVIHEGTLGEIKPPKGPARVASPLTSPQIAILAPRNRIRNGKIRLSGAKPNQVFSLKFLRKTKSGYKLHNSAQLPKQMTGAQGSFNLKALGGGDWRLNVCQTNGNDQFVGPQKCKQSDFYLPKKKKSLGKIKNPGKTPGSGPKPKTYKLVPGIGG